MLEALAVLYFVHLAGLAIFWAAVVGAGMYKMDEHTRTRLRPLPLPIKLVFGTLNGIEKLASSISRALPLAQIFLLAKVAPVTKPPRASGTGGGRFSSPAE